MILDIGSPNLKQQSFMLATKKHVGYGGARGGGKSWAVRAKAKLLSLSYAGIKILIVRQTYRELINNHIKFLIPELKYIAKYNKTDKEFTFKNGSTIAFGYCASDGDMEQYQGAEYDVIFLDEACLLAEEWIKKFQACLRGANDFPKRIYYTLNPGGRSHAYFKRLFIDRRFEPNENPDDYEFIQSLVTDNTALMRMQPDYKAQLEALPPKLRMAWLEGRWDVFAGQFFEEFVDRVSEDGIGTHVIKPFTPDPGWKIYRSYDWGYNKPFSLGWWAVDYDGIIYRIMELYGCKKGEPNEGLKWNTDTQFKEIARIEREHPWLRGKDIQGVADPSIWDGSHGISVAETAQKHGIYFTPGVNDRIAGWMQCHYRLSFDGNGRPMMYVFENCEGFRRTVPTLMYDDHKVEDVDTTGEDHVADEWRYFCMMRPIKPTMPQEQRKPIYSDPLELLGGRKWRQ